MMFQQFHPITVIVYYSILLVMATMTQHPIVIGLVLIAGLTHHILTMTARATGRMLVYDFFVGILLLLISIAFKHNGITPLFFWNDQAVTKEVLFWAICLGLLFMLLHTIYENALYHLATDRLLFACRLIWPAFGLFISMLMRFLPTVQHRFRQMHNAQKTIGYYATASLFDKGIGLVKTIYEATAWAFEQCFHKSDTMRARGYHLKKKSVFHLYRWHKEDSLVVAIWIICTGALFLDFHRVAFYYFPETKAVEIPISAIILVIIIAWLPVMIDLKERFKWLYYSSKM